MKATVPVGGEAVPVSCAVKVTDLPEGTEPADDARLTDGEACFTTCK
jgi:hypothetical protein